MKLQDHDEFPKFDHRAPPSRHGEKHRQESRRPGSQLPSRTGRRVKTGENSKPTNGGNSPAAQAANETCLNKNGFVSRIHRKKQRPRHA